MKIHGRTASGNCLKAAYLCDYLGLSYDWIDVGIFAGAARTPVFRALRPAGFDMDRVPAVGAWTNRCAALFSMPA